jgi:hypothetical protein
MLKTLLPVLTLFFTFTLFAQNNATVFPPDSLKKSVQAHEIQSNLRVDGRLEEKEWKAVLPTSEFFQVEPFQGKPLSADTEVKILYNRHYLYIAAFCKDSTGKRNLRSPNFKRDFEIGSHDFFGITIDGFNDKRNSMAILTNAYGTQRDLLAFDDNLFDIDWDGWWRVRTHRSDSGWTAEFAIPWQTLRYPKSNAKEQQWGINFFRNRRAFNELSGWNPYPRAFSANRMDYAGILTGIKPPPPSPNIRIQPYLLVSSDKYNGSEVGNYDKTNLKLGGEAKWAINSNTVLDLTFNTDFAQADVDRQVNNVTRFGVFFPERRQFFLENASLFGVGIQARGDFSGGGMTIQPFFSRRIGLDGNGKPIPIDAGVRLVYRSVKRNFGGILMRQRANADNPLTYYAVGRYSENIGKQNRMGGLFTLKHTEALNDTTQGYTHWVGATDGFFRLNESTTINYMAMASASERPGDQGTGGYVQLLKRSNQWIAWWTESLISKKFNPEVGFVSRNDIVGTTPGFYWLNRGKWLPKWVRGFEPGVAVEIYHKLSTGRLQEFQFISNPIWFSLQNGGFIGNFVTPVFQRLDDEDTRPLDIILPSGTYQYLRQSVYASTDQSRKLYAFATGETGGYYDGKLNYLRTSMGFSPKPHFSLVFNYEVNDLKHVGFTEISPGVLERYSARLVLWSLENRIAINPRIQLISFYQKNTFNNRDIWNIRFSWEFKPLSFLYLVYNNREYAGISVTDRQRETHLIGKVSYLKQF